MSIKLSKNKKSERRTDWHNIVTKICIRHTCCAVQQISPRQSEVPRVGHDIWKLRQLPWDAAECPSWFGRRWPLCRVRVGACWLCWTQRSPWLSIPPCILGWGAACRVASGPHGSGRAADAVSTHPRSTEDQEGSLAALCWIQASAETFLHCLTPPAGELTQRKVRAQPCQGSLVERKELYCKHAQEYCLRPIYFCQGCSEYSNSFNVFTSSGISFICPDMNTGEYQTWHTLGQGSAAGC